MSNVLTFDLGTSYLKVCVFDESLRLLAHERVATPVQQPAPGRSELLVPEFEVALSGAVLKLARRGALRDTKRISFASQANSFTLLDGNSRPLGPFWLWTDQRASEVEPLWHDFSKRPDFYATTGLVQFDHHFTPPKITWLRQQCPDVIQQARQLCWISDYLAWWLTGRRATEAGIAGLTGLVDIRSCQYCDEALRYFEIPSDWLPPIVRAGEDLGPIRQHFVELWGLPADCRVVMGCLDQYAGAIGAGVTTSHEVCETTGTVLATVTCAGGISTEVAAGVFQGPSATPGLYYRMMFSRISASLLEKYRNHLADHPEFADLDKLAAAVPRGAEGLRLHPDAPDLPADEMFVDKKSIHDRGHAVRAIMEAVASELRAQVTALCGTEWPQVIRSVGGAARSNIWLQIKSQTLGCPVEAVDCVETTSLGAARLATRQVDDDAERF